MKNVPYFAALFARFDDGWVGAEAELGDVESADDITYLMREAAVEMSGDPVLLLLAEEAVEAKDGEWFAVLRLDGEDDPRLFLSDDGAYAHSRLARLLLDLTDQAPEGSGASLGDPALLDDLATGSARLLTAGERKPAGDALHAIAAELGFADEYDRLRA